jgi:hypothetical protein
MPLCGERRPTRMLYLAEIDSSELAEIAARFIRQA